MGVFRKALAECLGVFIFVLIGGGAALNAPTIGLVGVALAHGLALFAMVSATAPVSGGHLNPAVTLAVLLKKEIGAWSAVWYMIFQLGGALLAASVLMILDPWRTSLGTPALSSNMGMLPGALLEVFFTATLVFVVIRTAVEDKSPLAPLAIGLTVAGLAFAFGSVTGASMNPARWFGPAILSGSFENHWVYWLAPILGSVLGLGFSEAVSMVKKGK